jgi:glutamate/tyrosine decarboxylase-like PLP-dependent enzyme
MYHNAAFLRNGTATNINIQLGTTYTGEYEDVKAVNDLLVKKNLDVSIHVDAASGKWNMILP